MEKIEKHKYELPCANCMGLVKLTAKTWLKYKEAKKLPFCVLNGCKKYQKYLSVDQKIEGE